MEMQRKRGYVEHVVESTFDFKFNNKRDVQARPDHSFMRVKISTEGLENDPYTCYRVGQQIQAMRSDNRDLHDYICQQDDVLTVSKRDYLVNTLMGATKQYLEGTLKVIPSTQNLRINIATCGVPPLVVDVPPEYQNPGFSTDFILFVTARPILGGGTLAFASSCASNNLGRPVAGHANFNASSLVTIEGDRPRQVGIAIHEISHALGFSSGRFNTFIKWLDNGNYQRLSESDIIKTVEKTGYSISRIITPSVAQAVQEHFNCKDGTIDGGDIEDGGSSGTAGSHWEKRVYNNEYMTGSDSNFPIYSNMTLALFYDSGWYEVDWRKAQDLIWGKNKGCSFAIGDCGKWPTDGGYLCEKINQQTGIGKESCTWDNRGHGYCDIRDGLSGIPAQFQHYGSPSVGGHSELMDYCGYVYPNVYCGLGSDSIYGQFDALNKIGNTGEQFTTTSMCYVSNLNKIDSAINLQNYGIGKIIVSPESPKCYNSSCAGPNDLRLQVGGIWYKCPANTELKDVIGFGGAIQCPDSKALCGPSIKYDLTWPEIENISPPGGPPGTVITITGKHFFDNKNMQVVVDGPCTNVSIKTDTTLTATIPGADYFVGVSDLAIFERKIYVYVKDLNRGYTSSKPLYFTISVQFDSEYIKNLFAWMGRNPVWTLIIIAVIVIPIVLILYCCCKGFKKPKKPKKADHTENPTDHYYDDHYGVDDYYDDYSSSDKGNYDDFYDYKNKKHK
jgi:leishmanolysin